MRRTLFALIASAAGLVGCDLTNPETGELSYAPCLGASGNPSWFAVQDGDSAWQRVTPSETGAYNFRIRSGRGGFAMYNAGRLRVFYASTAEMQAVFPSCNASVRTVSGSVMGYTTQDNVTLRMGASRGDIFGSQTPPASFALTSVDPDVTDLVAVRHRSASGNSIELYPDNIVIRRGVSGATTPVVNFASTTEAGAPLQRTLTITNVAAGEELELLSNIVTPTTLAITAIYETRSASSAEPMTAPFYGLPSSRLVSGEGHMLEASAYRQPSQSSIESRFATLVFAEAVDKSMTFGPVLGAITLSTGTSWPSATYTVQPEYANLWQVIFTQGTSRQVEVLATKGYLGVSATVTLIVPDLSAVTGFQNTWHLIAASSGQWTFRATSADITILNSKPLIYRGADRTSTFTP